VAAVVFFVQKYIKIRFFLKKLFLTSAHQNDPKIHKKFQTIFFLNHKTRFQPQKQTVLASLIVCW